MGRTMYPVRTSRGRLACWTWIWIAGSAGILATATAPARAQGGSRDTLGRVYRIQLRQIDDTTYRSAIRKARAQLKLRLDSLTHEFEDMSLEAPDRTPRLHEITALLSSLAKLSDLEEVGRANIALERSAAVLKQRAMVLGGGEGVAGMFQLSDGNLPRGWIGINVEAPHQRMVRGDTSFIRYFSYPEIVSVEPNSPAERVGISRGDWLVAYDGADVRDREINLTKLLQPSRRITVTVRRDGEEREFPVVVAQAPRRLIERRLLSVPDEPARAPIAEGFMVLPPPNGEARLRAPRAPRAVTVLRGDGSSAALAGASLSEIHSAELGRIFGVDSGLLVTEVFSDPAQGSGLRGGDVIVAADGQEMTRLVQLRRIITAHNDDRAVELEIVRQKRTRTITLRW